MQKHTNICISIDIQNEDYTYIQLSFLENYCEFATLTSLKHHLCPLLNRCYIKLLEHYNRLCYTKPKNNTIYSHIYLSVSEYCSSMLGHFISILF